MDAVWYGLKAGLNSQPAIKYIALGLIITLLTLKVYKWWITFKKKV